MVAMTRRRTAPMQTRADTRSERARAHLTTSAEVTRRTGEVCLDAILKAAEAIAKALRAGGKVLLCGNGGSAADCQHLAGEFMNRLTKDFDRPGMAVLALTTDTSFLTAFANDSGFDGVFERQVRALGRPGDVLMGISTSGKSRNVIRAVEAINAPAEFMAARQLIGSQKPIDRAKLADTTVSMKEVAAS